MRSNTTDATAPRGRRAFPRPHHLIAPTRHSQKRTGSKKRMGNWPMCLRVLIVRLPFPSTLADKRRRDIYDRAAGAKRPGRLQLLPFTLTGTQARVNSFARPEIWQPKGSIMSVKLAPSIVPTMEICPNCKGAMTIMEIAPILFADELEDVTYRCKACRSEMKRTFKRRSGAWQLVHYTPQASGTITDRADFSKPS